MSRALSIAVVFLLACGGSSDGGVDASADATLESSSNDATGDAPGTDAANDAGGGDSAADAANDVGTFDAGDGAIEAGDAGLCGTCPPNEACCTIPNAAYFGKCYSTKCLACCQ